jgi:hypothetical protein
VKIVNTVNVTCGCVWVVVVAFPAGSVVFVVVLVVVTLVVV